MGHEHFGSLAEITGQRPTDELARRLLDTGKVDGVHVYMNMITVDVKKGYEPTGLARSSRGSTPTGSPAWCRRRSRTSRPTSPPRPRPPHRGCTAADDAMSEATKKAPAALLERSRLARERAKAKAAAGE